MVMGLSDSVTPRFMTIPSTHWAKEDVGTVTDRHTLPLAIGRQLVQLEPLTPDGVLHPRHVAIVVAIVSLVPSVTVFPRRTRPSH